MKVVFSTWLGAAAVITFAHTHAHTHIQTHGAWYQANIQLEKEDFDQQKGKLLITEQNVYNILIATVIVPLQYIIKLIKIQ